MSGIWSGLKPFARRVRVMRAWRGAAIGLVFAGLVSAVWTGLDWFGVAFIEWPTLAALFGGGFVGGGLIGFALPVSMQAVARSVDRRAGLRDRLGTAIERTDLDESFDEAQRADARDALERIRPAHVYPVRLGGWQYTGVAMAALVSTLFFLGATGLLLSPEDKAKKEELGKIADGLERVARPLKDPATSKAIGKEEERLAGEFEKFAKQLEKGRIDKEEALKKANELAEKAEKLAEQRVGESAARVEAAQQTMAQRELAEKGLNQEKIDAMKLDPAQSGALSEMRGQLGMKLGESKSKLSQEQLKNLGLEGVDPELMNLSDEARRAIEEELNRRIHELEETLENSEGLSASELKELQENLQQAQALKRALKISEEARKAIQEFMDSPEFKELQKLAAEIRMAAQKAQKGDPADPLTEEQIKELERKIEELAKMLKDPEMREAILQALRDALERLKAGEAAACAGGT